MLAYRNGKLTAICDLCGAEMPLDHAYTEGVNRYCSFECMAEVNDVPCLIEEHTGIRREDYPDISDDGFVEMARSGSVMECGHDIGEVCEEEEWKEGWNIPVLLPWSGYQALGRDTSDVADGAYITTPDGNPDSEWKAKVFRNGRMQGDEITWPRLYSRSFRDEIGSR